MRAVLPVTVDLVEVAVLGPGHIAVNERYRLIPTDSGHAKAFLDAFLDASLRLAEIGWGGYRDREHGNATWIERPGTDPQRCL
jgi:hypothetical protein